MEFKRMTLEAPVLEDPNPEIEAMRQNLAKRAKDVLGYGLFGDHLRKKEEQKNADSLVQALVELEIEPLDTKEVEAYQKNQRKLKNREAFSDLPWYAKFVELWEKMAEKIFIKYSPSDDNVDRECAVFFLSGLIGTIAEIIALVERNWILAAIVFPFTFFFVSFFVATACLKVAESKGIKVKEWGWNSLTFDGCEKQKIEIPEFAIDTAIRVKERIPAAQVSVDALMSTERLLGDPFLVVQHGESRYYLEVWNESKFEGRRTA